MKTNGKPKPPMSPIFWMGKKEFVVSCGLFQCAGHDAAMELGKTLPPTCKRGLNFTGKTIELPAFGKHSTLNRICPILLIKED